MPAKKKTEASKRTKRSYGAKLLWVMNNLSADEVAHADKLAPTPAELFEFLSEAVDNGIDIKVSWDDYSNAYQATAIGTWEGYPSAGVATGGRSSGDCSDALLMLWYKVVIKAELNLGSVAPDEIAEGMRG